MKLLLFVDGIVSSNVFDFLEKNYREDIAAVVTTSQNELYRKVRSTNFDVLAELEAYVPLTSKDGAQSRNRHFCSG